MKKYIKQLLLFLLTICVLAIGCATINLHFIKKNITTQKNFKLADTVSTLLIGDSHLGLSLNPDFIPNSENQFMIGEHYLFTFTRLKYFLENNPQVKKVVLGYSYSNLAINTDEQLFKAYSKNAAFPKYFMLLNEEEIKTLYANDLIFFRNYLGWQYGFPTKDNIPLLLKTADENFDKNAVLPFRCKWSGNTLGNYNPINYKGALNHFNGVNPTCSEISIRYLYKIIKLCNDHYVELILYSSPLYPQYRELIPEYYIQQFDSLSNVLKREFNVPMINYINQTLPDSCYNDGNHLSGAGAKIISEKLSKDLITN